MPSFFLQHRYRTEYSTSFFQDLRIYLIEWVMPYKSILCVVIIQEMETISITTVVLPQDFQQIALPFAWPWTHMFSQTSLQSLEPTISYFNMIPRWWILSDPSGHNQRHVKQTDYSAGQWSIWQAPTVDRCLPLPPVNRVCDNITQWSHFVWQQYSLNLWISPGRVGGKKKRKWAR